MKSGLYLTFNFKSFIAFSVTSFLLMSAVIFYGISNSALETSVATISSNPVIIIDAGHGGEDGGTQSESGIIEKNINLAIALETEKILGEKGFETVAVRDGDYMIYDENASTIRKKKASDIHNRMKIMNENENCIFLSIHQNYFTQSKYCGAQVFYSGNHPDSEILACEIQKSIVSNLQPENTRQIKKSGKEIYLLYNAKEIAVMVECGFLSNKAEADKLADSEYQKQMASAIVDGLINYLQIRSQGENKDGSENKKYFRMQ